MTAGTFKAIVIGASAGALESLSAILPDLRGDFKIPVLIVVHLPSDRNSIMAGLLDDKCALPVAEAEDKTPIEPGHVYIAPPDYHMLVEKDGVISLSCEEPILFSRPAIDVLFETAAEAYGPALVGIVLSGANSDGAAGLRAISAAGGAALVQAPDTAYATAMPQAAQEACPAAQILTLDAITAYLNTLEYGR